MSSDHAADARAARDALERLLATEAPALAVGLPVAFLDAAERYVELLLSANARLNLTRVVEPEAVASLHLLDALSGLPALDEVSPSRALDLGSGGGVPGIVLALARPGVSWTLVDSVRKKAAVLVEMVSTLGLTSVRVFAGRAEEIGHDPEHRARHDVVTARACAALPILAEYALPLLRPGGRVVAWKGPIGPDELAAGTLAAARLGGGAPEVRAAGLPALGEHRIVVLPKVGTTPASFPRRPGEPSRRPLG